MISRRQVHLEFAPALRPLTLILSPAAVERKRMDGALCKKADSSPLEGEDGGGVSFLTGRKIQMRPSWWVHLDTATVRKRMSVVALAVPSQLSASLGRDFAP